MSHANDLLVEKVKVLHWNAQGLRSKFNALLHHANTSSLDVIMIQETFLTRDRKLPGYCTFYKHGPNGYSGGLLTAVRDGIPVRVIQSPEIGAGHDILTVALQTARGPVIFHNVYVREPHEIDFKALVEHAAGTPTAIGGDFNAHHVSWGARRTDNRGTMLVEALDESGLFTLMNDGTPTHERGGVLDLTLLTNEMAANATWSLNPALQSDHTAIEFTLLDFPITRPVFHPKWKLEGADWGKFQENIAQLLVDSTPACSLDEEYERLTWIIERAADLTFEATKPPIERKFLWRYYPEVRQAHPLLNQLNARGRTGRSPEHDAEIAEARANYVRVTNDPRRSTCPPQLDKCGKRSEPYKAQTLNSHDTPTLREKPTSWSKTSPTAALTLNSQQKR